ncbi:cytidine deaminase [Phototrophicus methaneseepsis]|uniref:Cytidine deaminase n=1 Tax=Phototrophicus methaneseepsis TaxID=2710758 RepID=A0A7S8E9W4_9CHLR|nr:cytidine deaminase [Phototrophicus methaneseepsis]QPC82939.1 cytidine deaminase [Phototrophicus methaneseepsis]
MTTAIQVDALIQAAITAADYAYVPYSEYPVGAALLTTEGEIFTGCNVENAAYPAGICGERTAVFKAVSEGERSFQAIAIATKNGGAPCGICRQVMYEFAPTLRVICCDFEGAVTIDQPLNELLVHGFGPSSLPRPD